MKKKGFELSLNTLVELIIAIIAITVVMIIIAAVVNVFTSPDKGEEYSLNGFMVLYTQLQRYEAEDGLGSEFDVSMHLADDFVIVGFSSNMEGFTDARCNFASVVDELAFESGFHPLDWAGNIMFSDQFGGGDFAELTFERPDTCMENKPCLCLCKQEFDQGRISCEKAATCVSFDDEHTKGIDFTGYNEGDVSCEIPLIYSQGGNIVNYCATRQSEGSGGGTWVFKPERC